jgi:mannose-6-phosphate isomerase-like protein (cupin superfamily)
MNDHSAAAFNPVDTYAFLQDGGAAHPFAVTERFWRELMAGTHREPGALPEARLAGEGDGWLLSAYAYADGDTHWECHPRGDEILVVLSGAMDAVLELPQGERVVPLTAGIACVVPRGVWHRLRTREPARLLALTYGKGTQHRED